MHRTKNPSNLTKRELECLFYLSRGYTIKEVAKTLELSPKTVDQYMERIRLRLNLSLRSELVKFYFTHFEGFRWH